MRAGATHARRSARTSASPASTATSRASGPGSSSTATAPASEAERLTDELTARPGIAGRCTASRSASRTSSTSSTGRPAAARSSGRTASPGRTRRACGGCEQAGAVLLGKTVTTQYASFDPPVTRNPWNLARTPGGSSQRLGGGGRVRHVPGGARVADRRLDHAAGVLLRRVRAASRPTAASASTACCRWRRRWTTSASWRDVWPTSARSSACIAAIDRRRRRSRRSLDVVRQSEVVRLGRLRGPVRRTGRSRNVASDRPPFAVAVSKS